MLFSIAVDLFMCKKSCLICDWFCNGFCLSFNLLDAYAKQKCFCGTVIDAAGFYKLISIKDFTDASNGYIVDDTCVYGAEVFVCKERRRGKGECLRKIGTASAYRHVIWKIDNFSNLGSALCSSDTFDAGGYKARLIT